jgi:endonuclease III-like uncharacterized protein
MVGAILTQNTALADVEKVIANFVINFLPETCGEDVILQNFGKLST